MSPELVAFAGAFAGGAAAGLVSAAARYLKLDAHLRRVATEASEAALQEHEKVCPWREVAARHVAAEPLLTPAGRWPRNG